MKLVGKVKDAHGLKGEIYILVFSGDISWLSHLKTCTLQSKTTLVSSLVGKVERTKPFKDGFILKLAEIPDRTLAEKYKGSDFLVEEDIFVSKKGETIFLNEILNFELKDPAQNILGKVVAFSSNGVQDLLVVERTSDQKKVDVPFVEAFINKIDWENKAVIMDLPEGLLDLD